MLGATHLIAQRRTSSDWRPPSDDAIGAEIAGSHIRDVHGTTTTGSVAVFAGKQFGHRPAGVGSPGDGMPMAPMGGGDLVTGD